MDHSWISVSNALVVDGLLLITMNWTVNSSAKGIHLRSMMPLSKFEQNRERTNMTSPTH